MVEHMLILLTALVVLGFRFARESMARQRLRVAHHPARHRLTSPFGAPVGVNPVR
jgi:hypothetical protein